VSTQSEYKAVLDSATTPEEKRDAALSLLEITKSRQYIDAALLTLESESVLPFLDDTQRPILREKCMFYYEQPPEKDKGGNIREKLTRLLVEIGHPGDHDLYLRGVNTYYMQPVDDVAQNLRAAALAGLATTDRELACHYATKLLGEEHTSVFNAEPSVTAVQVLSSFGHYLPVYQFILLRGVGFASQKGEAVAQAFESLPANFPAELIVHAAGPFIEMEAAVILTGIINTVVERDDDALHDLLERIITSTHDLDLHRYGVIMMAASRKTPLVERLFRLARLAHRDYIANYIEAVELTAHPERDTLLDTLHKRK